VPAPVSLVDVLPTLAELVGVDAAALPDEPFAGRSLVSLCDGRDDGSGREVVGEYMAEGSLAPIVMLRRGSWKFVHCPADPDQLYDLANDPDERRNLAEDAAHESVVAEFRSEIAARWDLPALHREVLRDQARRRYVDTALRQGRYTGWEYTSPREATGEYMRNHLDLNEVERAARWPR
jgi:choline-sulfatase